MITLKEAFRQQAFLQKLQGSCLALMDDEDFYTKKVEKHLRAKVIPGQENEEVDVSETRHHSMTEVVKFCSYLIVEEEKLAHAVHQAKAAMDFDLDTAVIVNKSRRRLANALKTATNFETEVTSQRGGGTGYVLDKDGKPATFSYDVETVTTIDFDRNKVKAESQTLFAASEKMSLDIDRAMLAEVVDYTPQFDPNDSLQNVMDDYLAKTK